MAMTRDAEQERLELEREKWLTEVELRKRELDLKEREQADRSAELELKRHDQAGARWRSPLVVAILAAAVAAAGNAGVTMVNGLLQRDLESRKRDAEIALENSKAESTRILEMIKTGNTETAASNLEFLVRTGLIRDPERVAKLSEFLQKRAPGGGPALPSPGSRVAFEPTEALSESVQGSLQKVLDEFIAYLDRVGFPAAKRKVTIKVDKLSTPNAYYSAGDDRIVIDTRLSDDASVAMREYTHHILTGRERTREWRGQYAAIESGLADYFACSFLDNPRLGEKAAKVFDLKQGYIRLLANDRKFGDFRTVRNDSEMPYIGAEIWGGALWAARARLGREATDPIVVAAWLTMTPPAAETDWAATFVDALVAAARAKGPRQLEAIQATLRDRGFPVHP